MTDVCKPFGAGLALWVLAAGCAFVEDSDSNAPRDTIPIVYVKRDAAVLGDPTATSRFAGGGDLFIKDIASINAPERNLTAVMTRGVGDVQGPEVDYTGTRVVFSMRCGAQAAIECANDNTWNIWEYVRTTGELRRIIRSSEEANVGDDLDPAYLPDGRIVFTSNRQSGTAGRLGYRYLDGERKEYTYNLHVMDADGRNIEQISFGLSHDRFPVVTRDGHILFSRWDKSAAHSKFGLYRIRPDGRALTPYYGMHSPGGAFLQPRELPDGRLIANVAPLSGTFGGGALMYINAQKFGDISDGAMGAQGSAQIQAAISQVSLNSNFFAEPRFAFPNPVLDGSGRILVSFAQPPGPTGAPHFGLYMYDPGKNTLLGLALPSDRAISGDKRLVVLESAAMVATPPPPVLPPAMVMAGGGMAMGGTGIINIKSVYDVDGIGYVGTGVLTASERGTKRVPTKIVANDPRGTVVDIAAIRDPGIVRVDERPARFVRVVSAIPVPESLSPVVIGKTPMGPKKIQGYAQIEPDGSVRVRVPADMPLAITVLSADGHAYADHDDWFQVRPGEELVCNGCHSPKRLAPLNTGAANGDFGHAQLRKESGEIFLNPRTGIPPAVPLAGETMAEMRTRLDPMVIDLMPDLHYYDVWSHNVSNFGTTLHLHYRDLPAEVPAPTGGVVDYTRNVQPIWDRKRPVLRGNIVQYQGALFACADCHNGIANIATNPSGLTLRGGLPVPATERLASYDALLEGKIEFNAATNKPYYTLVDGRVLLKRAEALVVPGMARKSHLVEVLWGQELFAARALTPLATHLVDHYSMLTESEKLIIAEWIDIGAQYYNAITDSNGQLISKRNFLPPSSFEISGARFVLNRRCWQCHLLLVNGAENPLFRPSQFILTGNFEDDYLAAAAMADDLQVPDNSRLLKNPRLTTEHYSDSVTPIFDLNRIDDAEDYAELKSWVSSAR